MRLNSRDTFLIIGGILLGGGVAFLTPMKSTISAIGLIVIGLIAQFVGLITED